MDAGETTSGQGEDNVYTVSIQGFVVFRPEVGEGILESLM